MIHAIRCDQPQFKAVEFTRGFNVVLADRTKESTRKDTRNGLGKTTLIEIIHFCLGADAKKGKGLLRKQLAGWTFTLDLDLRGKRCLVHRNTSRPNWVGIQGDTAGWPFDAHDGSVTDTLELRVREWNRLLGWLLFDLPASPEDQKYSPTFRSLISYFVRKGRDAFSTPFEHHRKQLEWDKQVNNAFLLSLAWEHASRWQVLRDQGTVLRQLKQAAQTGLVRNLVGAVGELESRKVRLEEQITRGGSELATFRVHPQYQDIETETTVLTSSIHALSNENLGDRRMLEFYESGLREEQPATEDSVATLYQEAGVVLPAMVRKRLEDVRSFHQQVVSNRREFLRREIERLRQAIAARDDQIGGLIKRRADLLSILRTHGALDEYTSLQQRHTQTVGEFEDVKQRLETLRKFEKGASALRIEREELLQEARSDYEERVALRQRAVSLFNANSEALYQVPGKLILDVGPNGFLFDVEIERSTSQGIEQMKVFCYDLMLAGLWAAKPVSPGFLVHDSTIFDGVDERQVAQALQLAAARSENGGFQYICCLNSDLVPRRDLDPNFAFDGFVRLRLTDATEDGGLLGIRF